MRRLDLRRRAGPPREPLITLREFAESLGIAPLKLRSMLGHTPEHFRPRHEFPNSPCPYYYRRSVLEAWLSTYHNTYPEKQA